jgi:RNA polymerase sigma factor (sigma-70 family)
MVEGARDHTHRPRHLTALGNCPKPSGHEARSAHEEAHGELLRRAAKGDRIAWEELVNRFDPLVQRTARRTGLNQSDAADTAQLTWLRLLQHLDQVREPERLPGWLVTTARRESVRVAIAAKRHVLSADPVAEHSDEGNGVATDVYPVEGEYEPDLDAALNRLPSRYQKLIRLLMCDNCPSYTEVAERMGVPIGSIGPMRMRGLNILRRAPELAAAGAS